MEWGRRCLLVRNPTLLALLPLLSCAEYAAPLELLELWSGTSAPARAGAAFQLIDADGMGISAITANELTLTAGGVEVTDFTLRSWEDLDLSEPLVLLIDASAETVEDPEAIAAMRALASEAVMLWPAGQPVQIATFADGVERLQRFTTDKAEALAAIEDITLSAGSASNLRGAVVESLTELNDRLDLSAGAERGLILAITDGGEAPALPSVEELVEARGAAGVMVVAVGSRGLAKSFQGVANQGIVRVKRSDDITESSDALNLALGLRRRAFMMVSFCSEERGGEHALELVWRRGRLGASWQGSYDATGFDDEIDLSPATDLVQLMSTHSGAVEGGWLYLGGGDSDGASNTWYAPVLDDGRLGNWREGPTVPGGGSARIAAGEGHLYAVNGPEAWVAELGEDGAPGDWVEMQAPGYSNDLDLADGVLYAISRDRAWHASVADGGPASEWVESAPFPSPLEGFVASAVVDGLFVVVGTTETGQPQRSGGFVAELQPDGGLGDWASLPAFPGYRGTWTTLVAAGGHVLSFPGDDADDNLVMSLAPGGAWATAGELAFPRRYYSVVGDGVDVYLHGGYASSEQTREGLRGAVNADGRLAMSCEP